MYVKKEQLLEALALGINKGLYVLKCVTCLLQFILELNLIITLL